MKKVTLNNKVSLTDYEQVVGSKIINELRQISKKLGNIKIVEINATAQGGGVAELLRSQIPFANALNIKADWYVLPPNERFFMTTKGIYDCLQGLCNSKIALDFDYYQSYLDSISSHLPEADLYVLHDPQTLGLLPYLKHKSLIWRCHLDLTDAEPISFNWLKNFYNYFDQVIFSLEAYKHDLESSRVSIVHPAIDPLSSKNIQLDTEQIKATLHELNINPAIPYILQVSRFDKFKNQIGVIELYEQLKKRVPVLQCILAGNYADDDPEGFEYYATVQAKARQVDDQNIKIIVDADNIQINALQQAASIVIQNSNKEGFGLTVTEPLWKKKIVFSRPVGGITLQIINGKTGYYLAENDEKILDSMARVIAKPQAYNQIGQAAHDLVKKHFVLPVMLRDYLNVYYQVINRVKK